MLFGGSGSTRETRMVNYLDITSRWVYTKGAMSATARIQEKINCPDWCVCGRSSIRSGALSRGTGSGFSLERR